MKYTVIGFVILILSGWYWFKSTNPPQSQQVKVYGQVVGLQGKMTLKIEDYYLNLTASDRFSLLVNSMPGKEPTIQLATQPTNQYCNLLTSTKDLHKINLKVTCNHAMTKKYGPQAASIKAAVSVAFSGNSL